MWLLRYDFSNIKRWLPVWTESKCQIGVTYICKYFLTINPFASEAVYTRNFFSTACRTACKHAFRFLRVLPEAVSTRHSWLWQTLDDVYTRRCFSESEGNTLRCPRTKGTAVSEWVNGMEWVNGFLPNPFIHDLFCWSSRHKFVKTDL